MTRSLFIQCQFTALRAALDQIFQAMANALAAIKRPVQFLYLLMALSSLAAPAWAAETDFDLSQPNEFRVLGDLSNVQSLTLRWSETAGGPYTEVDIPVPAGTVDETSHGIASKGETFTIEWPGLLVNGQPSTVKTSVHVGRASFRVYWTIRVTTADQSIIDTPEQSRDVF
ncbi:hypothetical protein [Candidatus Nitronereus thalassa]|uniref:Uncharacterized protein n=1 Tax=Candidatus Nitronereus thalassa TaxID=3020898 RepID=A0ABU3K392_9BACT|nr:hypothetical protein [Candidatus Nitronereus thalassa]MDT7040844.1 hypothetical protein [Candidatus Nitronereus thalassa]